MVEMSMDAGFNYSLVSDFTQSRIESPTDRWAIWQKGLLYEKLSFAIQFHKG